MIADIVNRHSRHITTLDIIKCWALLIMMIDHLGFFFMTSDLLQPVYPDPMLWPRAIGRLCVPIWFFLIGYAHTRTVTPLMLGGATMLGFYAFSGQFIFPVSILFGFVIIRLLIDKVAAFAFARMENLVLVIFAVLISSLHTSYLIEYGSVGFLIALFGYAVRQRGNPDYPLLQNTLAENVLYWTSMMFFAFTQGFFFMFDRSQLGLVAVGSAAVLYLLQKIDVRERPDLDRKCGAAGALAIKLIGRHTLFIYITHLLLLHLYCWGSGCGYPIYGVLDPDWTMTAAIAEMKQDLMIKMGNALP